MDEKKIETARKLGLHKEVERVQHGFCPFCAKPVSMEDFRDALSVKEFRLSGICQPCQDSFFGKGD